MKEKLNLLWNKAISLVKAIISPQVLIVAASLIITAIGIGWEFQRAEKLDAERGVPFSMDNPKETFYSDLEYGIMDYRNDVQYKALCTELAVEGQCPFEPETNYEIRFDFPDVLIAEIENELTDEYEVDVQYSFQVAAGEYGWILIRIYNPQSGRLFTARSSFQATDDLYIKHDIDVAADDSRLVQWGHMEFNELRKYMSFTLYTSANPDAGPKQTTTAVSFDSIWYIRGTNQEF